MKIKTCHKHKESEFAADFAANKANSVSNTML